MTKEDKAWSQVPPSNRSAPLSALAKEDVEDFVRALHMSKQELDIARQQFENVVDERLIDHVVFRLGAAERHFSYLLGLARQWNISLNGVRWDWDDESGSS